jgi:2-polyprenyl-6-methoxyphenol hydroxylase-like FAD-dependent oxidoreductase
MLDLVIAGGGPAGLALAIAARREGLSVAVCERRAGALDKACGEGVLPPGVRALAALGVRVARDESAPIDSVAWISEDGGAAEARLPAPGGLGVRRIALAAALEARARSLGVAIVRPCAVRGFRLARDRIVADTDRGAIEARLLVAADGLASPLRRLAGLERPSHAPRRFGLRRHFRIAPWSRRVEVHFSPSAEAYVTPAGRERIGVAFLFRPRGPIGFDALLAQFPALAARLSAAPADSRPLGAGPLARAARARIADRLLLFGDAAGYVDAISGEGLSLAFRCAVELAPRLDALLARGADRRALAPWEQIFARHFRRYAVTTRALLALAAHPRARRAALAWLARHPATFDRIVAFALDDPQPRELQPSPV